jgi:hypothetical protein
VVSKNKNAYCYQKPTKPQSNLLFELGSITAKELSRANRQSAFCTEYIWTDSVKFEYEYTLSFKVPRKHGSRLMDDHDERSLMAIYVDEIKIHPSGEWCHLMADSDEELHTFAAKLGMSRSWVHHHRGRVDVLHYDLRPSKRALAIQLGATEVKTKDYLRCKLREIRPY